jgi:glycosyltransferase involved in cell wall biosynthesis
MAIKQQVLDIGPSASEVTQPASVTLSVVIPALNEERGISDILTRALSIREDLKSISVDGLEVIVVDDGSSDRTAEIVAEFPSVRLVRHAQNRGYGAAIKTGFCAARGELLAFLDADGTYPPERLPSLCRVALAAEADVVVGSRRSGAESQMPVVRRLGNLVWSSLISLIGNQSVRDPASGMRIVRRAALEQLYPLPDGLNFTPVMSTRSVHEGLKVVEIPIAYRERVGRSKLSVIRDGSRFLATIISTSLEYNPVRLLGLVGLSALALALAIGVAILAARLQGVTHLGAWGVFAVFAALVLAVIGVSIFTLGVTFTYLVSLFHRRPIRQGLFGRPVFTPPLDRHFGWLGLIAGSAGVVLSAGSLGLGLTGWDVERLWLWLLISALLVLVGVQLVISWILASVLGRLSEREARVGQEIRPLAGS